MTQSLIHPPRSALASYPSLAGKTVVVTGGGSGIGAELVASFARQKARVFFIDIAEDSSRALAFELGAGVKFFKCDLTDVDGLRTTLSDIAAEAGPITTLVNNAANDDRHKTEDVTPAYWENRLAVNLRHQFFAAQAVAPGMKAAGGGSIINLGSVSWHLGMADLALYEISKAGIEGLTRALARDFGGSRIRVNCVIPGAVRTPRQIAMWHTPEEEVKILEQQCIKERIDPIDIAAMVLFLASDDARMCTGHNYWVDAGHR